MPRKSLPTNEKLLAIPPDGVRHVTADRQTTLCGVEVTTEWYAGDAGDFGDEGDCAKCYTALKGNSAS